MQVTIQLIKAFTKDKTQGNPAGVVLDANGLSDAQMQKIATQLGFSESAFVQVSDEANFRVRFFSVSQEVDFCGHATIATFYALLKAGRVAFGNSSEVTLTQQTKAGVLKVTCHSDGKIIMTQADPQFGFIEPGAARIATLLGLPKTALLDLPIQSVSTGVPKLMIPVATLSDVQKITPDLPGIADYCREQSVKGFYPFTAETLQPESDFYARQFNPAAGINEDPITGVAAGALGSYAKKYELTAGKQTIIIEQGFGMNMGGTMFVDVTSGVRVGGYAAEFGKTTLEV